MGVISGPLKDVLDEAAQSIGMSIAWSQVPFARSLKQLEDNAAVIVPRVRRTPKREQLIQFLGQFLSRSGAFVVRKGNEGKLKDCASLAPRLP